MKRYLSYFIFLLTPILAQAQEDVVYSGDNRVRGFVHKLKVRRDMLYMAGDTITYGENKGIHIYTFDDNSRIISDTSVTDFNHDTSYYSYVYNEEGKLVAIKGGYNDIIYNYTNGKLALIDRSPASSDSWYFKRSYVNERDSVVETFRILTLGRSDRGEKDQTSEGRNVYFHNDKDQITSVKHCIDGKLNTLTVLGYDPFGNPIRKIVFDATGKIMYDYTYVYTYDAHHNFTERMEYRFGQPYSITKREIIYQ